MQQVSCHAMRPDNSCARVYVLALSTDTVLTLSCYQCAHVYSVPWKVMCVYIPWRVVRVCMCVPSIACSESPPSCLGCLALPMMCVSAFTALRTPCHAAMYVSCDRKGRVLRRVHTHNKKKNGDGKGSHFWLLTRSTPMLCFVRRSNLPTCCRPTAAIATRECNRMQVCQ